MALDFVRQLDCQIALTYGTPLFSWYVYNFENYSQAYGDLRALIGFPSWRYTPLPPLEQEIAHRRA